MTRILCSVLKQVVRAHLTSYVLEAMLNLEFVVSDLSC